jgi:CRP-like cAMP-binding protein
MSATITDGKIRHLRLCPLFNGISAMDMEQLRHTTTVVQMKPQDRILTSPSETPALWLVKEGLVSLTYGDAEGKDATVLLLGPDDLFGALQGNEEYEYGETVVALKPTVLCRMNRHQLEILLHKYPEVAYQVAQFCWHRIARLQQRLADIMTRSVKERLAMMLLKMAADYGEETSSGRRSLGLLVTHDDLARLVGSSREMVSKIIGQFRNQGWIRTSRRSIEVMESAALGRIAGMGEPQALLPSFVEGSK